MMLPLVDAQVRLALLNHMALHVAGTDPKAAETDASDHGPLKRLRKLSPVDLNRLASMRDIPISVGVDSAALGAGLRVVELINEAVALRDYFIRHGASWQMMTKLFKVPRKLTLRLRKECGAWRPRGQLTLPDRVTRARVHQAWARMTEADVRMRYYRLHQRFPYYSIAVLDAIVRAPEDIR